MMQARSWLSSRLKKVALLSDFIIKMHQIRFPLLVRQLLYSTSPFCQLWFLIFMRVHLPVNTTQLVVKLRCIFDTVLTYPKFR